MDVNNMIGLHTILDKEVPYLKLNEEGEPLLKIELRERIEKINRNVDKIGSIDALKNMSPASMKYVINTYNYIRYFYITGEIEDRLLEEEQLKKAVDVLDTYAAKDKLDELILSGWNNVLSKFEEAKSSFAKAIA